MIPGPPTQKQKQKAQLLNCHNNLKQAGIAYNIWSVDHGGFPMKISVTNGGTMELMETADAWQTYQVMSNELSTPKILFCPADVEHHMYATNFSGDLKDKISYFIGLDAGTNAPKSFLAGDDNLAAAGQPVKPGMINLVSNGPITWTATRHYLFGNNLLFSDGRVWYTQNLATNLTQTGWATNRLAIP
jgi:hypothetical protein